MDADRQVARAQANCAAWLALIRACEGTAGPNGYRTLFGGSLFDNFDAHPNIVKTFRWTDGTVGYTTAAGAYQFLFRTWQSVAIPMRLPDFSPTSQDRAAIELTARRKALDDVVGGRVQEAINKCWPEWASLPASQYLQPRRSLQFAANAFANAGGVLA